jgi:uncharacterized protein (TIGR01777 family)
MDIAVTGATGLIGTALTERLQDLGHSVRPVVRSAPSDPTVRTVRWDPAAGTIDADALAGVDAVVHLAGQGIASKPWTPSQRRRLVDSRIDGTTLLARTLAQLDPKPQVLVSASAIGYYGDRDDEVLTESSRPGHDFLADLCVRWEASTAAAEEAGIRVVHVRSGIVLARKGGALGAQLPIFRLGLGGQAGSGRQWMSWITLHDEVDAIVHALERADVTGPLNLTAPNPVTNAQFTKALGHRLHRPTVVRIPRFVAHVPFGVGPLVHSLLFSSARVEPAALTASGFEFAHPDLDEALASVLS